MGRKYPYVVVIVAPSLAQVRLYITVLEHFTPLCFCHQSFLSSSLLVLRYFNSVQCVCFIFE